jgi:NAD+ synthase (glutamine-hydrolysing)
MDLSNKLGGIVIGTGDMSEIALGWCTYNGDQMSMYNVNAGVPKTMIQELIKYMSENKFGPEIADVLKDICNTPISPELLPPDVAGNIEQKTESEIGPYELHDFFLFHHLKSNFEPQKIAYMCAIAFHGKYSELEIKKWLNIFYKRFFTQQFKRNPMPDGPKVCQVSLSPRGELRLPSEFSPNIWLMD